MEERARQQFGQRLRASRMASGMSGVDFAERIGVTANMLYQVESGRKFLSIGNTVHAARLLGVTVEWLFEGDDEGSNMGEEGRHEQWGGPERSPITPQEAIANYELIMSEPNLFLRLKGSSLTVQEQADIADYIRFVRRRERQLRQEGGRAPGNGQEHSEVH